MTDIEQLMQNSEAMRMLKLGNPERSKDFNLPEMPIGLFDIERQVKEPLRNAIQLSDDPNGAIDNFDTALMLNNFGIDMDTAHSMAKMGFSSSVTGIDTRDKTYSQALGTAVKHAWWNELKGINTSLYMITKNRDFIDNADKYNLNITNNPIHNTYGWFGDLTLDSVQPVLSAAKFMATTAILSWIPGGISSAVWGPAVGKLVAGTGGIAANAVNFFSAGYSQAGDVLYNVMQMEDANGNKLPWDSIAAQALFHGLAGLMGIVELGSMEMFPWYKHLKTQFTKKEVVKHMERGFLSAGKNFLWEGGKGTLSESGEEGVQTLLGIGYESLLKYWANKEGANFEIISIKDAAKEAAEATYQAGRSMFLTSFFTAGFGQSVYSLRLRAEAKKNFTPTSNSIAVDSGFVGVPRSAVESMEEGVSVGSMEPIKVVNVGDHLAPIDDVELKKAARAVKNGIGAMEVIVEDFPAIDTSDYTSMLHLAAIATEGKILNDSELGFESEEDLNRAMYLLSQNVEAIEQNEKGASLVIRNVDGDIARLQLSLIEEGQEYVEPDISYIDNVESPHALSTMSQDKALEWHERNIIKEAIGDLVTHTKGRLSSADLEANVDAVKLASDILQIPTDQMLKDNLVFKLEPATLKGERGYIENVTVEGKKQYTIHLSEKADATTLLHELGHFIRGTASKEQLADFTKYYGKGAEAVWIEDINKIGDKYHVGEQVFDSFDEAKKLIEANEEAFADDFVAYLRTGQAPTSGLRNIFQRLKAVLSRFVNEFGYKLDPFVKNAFDKLLGGDYQVSDIDLTSRNAEMANHKLYQQNPEYKAVVDRYEGTEAWMKAPNGKPTNLTERQWVIVRTPSFKRWFGDWEAAENFRWLMEAEPIASLTGMEFPEEDTPLSVRVFEYFQKEYGGVISTPLLGDIIFSKKGIKSSVFHGMNSKKAATFVAMPEILQEGRIFSEIENYKDRGYTALVIAAPIAIGGEEYVAEVVVNKGERAKYYLHNVDIKERLRNEPLKDTSFKGDSSSPASKLIISRLLAEGKFESSVIVDENGEPKPFYHGSRSEFYTFEPRELGSNTGAKNTGYGFYFSSNKEYAERYGLKTRYDVPIGLRSVQNLINEALGLIKDDSMYRTTVAENGSFSNGPEITGAELRAQIKEAIDTGVPFASADQVSIASMLTKAIPLNSERSESFFRRIQRLENKYKQSYSNVYEVFLNIRNPSTAPDFSDFTNKNDGVFVKDIPFKNANGEQDLMDWAIVSKSPDQIRPAVNIGTSEGNNTNTLFQQAPPPNSDEFKQWFGDSKIVDDNGNPLKVYHGTDQDFSIFEEGDIGFHFGTLDAAKSRSGEGEHIMPVYLRIQNPLVVDTDIYQWDGTPNDGGPDLFQLLESYGIDLENADLTDEEAALTEEAFEEGDMYTALLGTRRAIQNAGYDGIIYTNGYEDPGSTSYIVFNSNQVKSVDNRGSWDLDNPNILYQQAIDKRYFEALDNGDEETAQRIVDEQARQKGYISTNDFRMNHKAPNSHNGYDVNLITVRNGELIPTDFWKNPGGYLSGSENYSFYVVNRAINEYESTGSSEITLYRAIPATSRETKFRNGDWVTPDRGYAQGEGLSIPGGYKIISETVPIEHVWWDGNSINEFGFDDGKDYAYKDTKNNKKLTDVVVKDEEGNIIPPSKRFNYRSDTLYQKAPPKGSKEFQEIFKHTKAVNKDGSPALLYHGSPVTNLESLDNTNANKINGGEPGYTYATDSYEAADNFAYEQLPGSSSYTYIPGERGQIYKVYMDIRNPLDFRSLSPEDIANIKDAAQKYGPFEKEVTSTIDDFIIKGRDKYSLQFIKNMAEDVVKHLEEYGYDGLITELDNNGNLEYATVSPNQVFMVSTEGLDAGESFGAMNDNKNSSTNKLFQNARVDFYDGLEYIKHDEGYAYDEEKIRELDTEITEVFEDIQRWFDFESGQYIPDREGVSGNLSGPETSEVRQSWRESRRIDFVGKKIANVKDLAEMFSVYRNNEIELFHIIYVDDQNNILAHNALSSGLPGFTIAVDSRTAARSLYRMESRMERLGASGYYMMHNHPSGNVNPSQEDLGVTAMYANSVDGFKGHIILDHTEFTLLKREEGHINHSKDRYSPVKMDARKLLSGSIDNPDKVLTYVSEYLTDNNKNVYLIVDTHYRLIEARPVKRPSYLSAYEAMRSAKGSYVFLGTTDRSVFNEIIKNSEKQKSGIGVFRDVVLIDDNSSASLFETTGKHPEWMKTAIGKRGNKSRNKYLFDSGSSYSSQNNSNVLYQLSAEEKKSLLEARRHDVKTAIEQFYWVPTEVLVEYVGEEWADNEIAFREHLRTYPWILEEARNHTEAEEFLEYLKENTEMGDYHWALEDELWFKRIHAYSRIMSPADKDAQFVRYHTRSNEALLNLGQQLKGYLDVVNIGKRSNRRRDKGMIISYRWGSFEGVSTVVKRLTADSTQAEFDRARKLIEDNPRPYRRALMLVDQATARVEDFRGNASVDASREAYYESFGEELAEALNEPVQLNEMTDRETARLLRESDDKKVRYDARAKLATHAGVIAMEQQANAELKKLGEEKDASIKNAKKQLSMAQMRLQETTNLLKKEQAELREANTALRKERARSESLTTRLEKKSARASKVGQLERDLADRRSRVRQLRSELTAQNEKLRSTNRKVEILEGKLKTQRLRKALEGMHRRVLDAVKFNPDTLDASFEESFNHIRSLFDQNQKTGGWKLLPQEMSQYLAEEHLHAIQQGRKINQWTLGDLEKLLEAAKLMRMDARVMLEKKKLQRMNNLANLSIQMYKQTYGENPEISVKYGSLMNDIIDDLSRKRDTYEENIFNAVFNTVRASVGKMQRIARMIDGHKEGVAYQLLVRDAYERMTEELRESYRRLNDADAKMKELKITSEYLVKDAFTYKTSSGQKKTLSKGEVIGLYVYSQNPVGAQKLVHNRGNNIPSIQLAEAIASLTDSDKSWGDYMIDSLGGDEVWERMRNTYYEVYNQNLGRRERYFTFVTEGKIGNEGKTDLLVGPLGSKVRYVDKDFTKLINPNAIYPLKLNVTQTFTSQIKKQEHFVQWADWVRDMNYLLTRGAFGRIIDMNHGPKYLHAVQEYVNDVGSPQMILDDIERLGSKIISNAAVAVLSLNALTILKQLPSFATALRGDVGIMDFFGVAIRLLNPKTHAEAIKFIHEMSPYMQKRAISVEVERYNATDFDSYAGRKVQAFNEKIGMKGVHLADQAVVNTLWLAAYDTYIRRNPNKLEGDALKKEAAFRATQLISETQPTSIANDLSSIQRKKNPFARMMIMFSNQIFQYINMVWYDLPTSMKAFLATKDRHELRKVFGIVTNMAVAGGLMLLASGVAFKGDDDDEEYWKKIRREIASITATYTIPIVGNAVSQGVSGFYGGDLVDLPSVFGRMMGTVATDWEDMDKRLWDLLDGVGKVGGLPTTFINRTIRGVQNENPLELLGPAYRELWEVR